MQDQAPLGTEAGLAIPDLCRWHRPSSQRSGCTSITHTGWRRSECPPTGPPAQRRGRRGLRLPWRTSACRSTCACWRCTRPAREDGVRQGRVIRGAHAPPSRPDALPPRSRCDGTLVRVEAHLLLDGGSLPRRVLQCSPTPATSRSPPLPGPIGARGRRVGLHPTTPPAVRCVNPAPCNRASGMRPRWIASPPRSGWTPSPSA